MGTGLAPPRSPGGEGAPRPFGRGALRGGGILLGKLVWGLSASSPFHRRPTPDPYARTVPESDPQASKEWPQLQEAWALGFSKTKPEPLRSFT